MTSDNNERTSDLVANIYDLSEAEFTKIQEQEGDSYVFWRQLLPGCQEFGERILTEATTSSKVISISGGFGSGKTHFITRFCEYAKKKKHKSKKEHKSHYLSVCEDYYDDPVILLSKMLYKAFPSLQEKCNKILEAFLKSWSANIGIQYKIINANFGFDMGKFLESFKKHPMEELKKHIKECCDKQKAILIFDELDRCEPEFALGFLKLIKHFSGIEGLSIILVFNKTVLCKILNNRYGIDFNEGNNEEDYFLKFIDREFPMPIPNKDDYLKVVNRFVKGLPNLKDCEKLKEITKDPRETGSPPRVFFNHLLTIRQIESILSNFNKYNKKTNEHYYLETLINILCLCIKNQYKLDDKEIEKDKYEISQAEYDEMLKEALSGNNCREILLKYGLWGHLVRAEIKCTSELKERIETIAIDVLGSKGIAERFTASFMTDFLKELKEAYQKRPVENTHTHNNWSVGGTNNFNPFKAK